MTPNIRKYGATLLAIDVGLIIWTINIITQRFQDNFPDWF
jgi:hypothetical protein